MTSSQPPVNHDSDVIQRLIDGYLEAHDLPSESLHLEVWLADGTKTYFRNPRIEGDGRFLSFYSGAAQRSTGMIVPTQFVAKLGLELTSPTQKPSIGYHSENR